MCPGPQHEKGSDLLKSTVAAAAAGVNGKEEGVWEFFRSYTDEPHKSRYVVRERDGTVGGIRCIGRGWSDWSAGKRPSSCSHMSTPPLPLPPSVYIYPFHLVLPQLSLLFDRRGAILKAHPEIRKLFGPCPWTKYKAAAIITTQVGREKEGGREAAEEGIERYLTGPA